MHKRELKGSVVKSELNRKLLQAAVIKARLVSYYLRNGLHVFMF